MYWASVLNGIYLGLKDCKMSHIYQDSTISCFRLLRNDMHWRLLWSNQQILFNSSAPRLSKFPNIDRQDCFIDPKLLKCYFMFPSGDLSHTPRTHPCFLVIIAPISKIPENCLCGSSLFVGAHIFGNWQKMLANFLDLYKWYVQEMSPYLPHHF